MEDSGWRRNKYGGLFNVNEYMNNKIRNKGKEFQIANEEQINEMDKQTANIKNSMSKEEKKAMGSIAGIGHREINETLLFGEPKEKIIYTNIDDIKKDISLIENVLKKSKTKNNLTVFRGTYEDLSKYKSGDIITMNNFPHTSLSENIAKRWAFNKGEGGCMIQIEVPKGTNGLYLGDNFSSQNEKELLLKNGLQYRLKNKKRKNYEEYGEIPIYTLKVINKRS